MISRAACVGPSLLYSTSKDQMCPPPEQLAKIPLLYLCSLTYSPTFFLHWSSSLTSRLLGVIISEFLNSSSIPCSSPTEDTWSLTLLAISLRTPSTDFFCSLVCPSPLIPQDLRNSRSPLGRCRLSAHLECSLQCQRCIFLLKWQTAGSFPSLPKKSLAKLCEKTALFNKKKLHFSISDQSKQAPF